ncbi:MULTISPECIES: BCD family MFS transporter [Sphingosinicellaceae]|uniref:BCD family MFS transporter n=1 Tax=Sphingosinicellaceae TaxID=2820280 RepID=UPI00272DC05E|nr:MULTISPECIES: BCD family MFS transporter [Polymorphobacter]
MTAHSSFPGVPPMPLLGEGAAPKGKFWQRMGTQFLPFADAATEELPLARLFRLSLFQITVGMAAVMLVGTLNRVMIVELHVPSWLVAMMVSLPLVFAPLRALIGHKSDNHRSILGWKRVPYIWFGTLLQFGGFAIMPFALLIMSGDTHGSPVVGEIGAALAFLMTGAGMHTVQTAGLALATDLAPAHSRPRVVALMYVMLLIGMLISGLVIGALLHHFDALKLVKVVQGAGALTMVVNLIALWKQEARNPAATRVDTVGEAQAFSGAWADFIAQPRTVRLLVAVGLGAAAFNMQDVLLEPYGGEVLHMTVGETTALTALWAFGTLIGLGIAARLLGRQYDPSRLAGYGVVPGLIAFAAVALSGPLGSPWLLAIGVAGIGLGGGLFSVGTLTAAMALSTNGQSGLAIGAWGAVQASCAGVAIALAGIFRDVVTGMAMRGDLGTALTGPASAYGLLYGIEIILLFATLAAIGPLALPNYSPQNANRKFGMSELPA